MLRRPRRSALFPYTTLFRSHRLGGDARDERRDLGGRAQGIDDLERLLAQRIDRKSTRLNSSHRTISYAVFCLKKKKHEPLANPLCRYLVIEGRQDRTCVQDG